MSDDTAKSKKLSGSAMGYRSVAVAFLAVAISMGLGLQNWAVALPFIVLTMTFFVLSEEEKKKDDKNKKAIEDE